MFGVRVDKKRLLKRRIRRREILLILECFCLTVLLVTAFFIHQIEKLDYTKLDESVLECQNTPKGYFNFALFGLDSREGELEGGVRSDCIMIANLDTRTGELKLVSVYRDTLLKQQDGTYDKANAAYSYGGPQEAIAMLNRNLDLGIEQYAAVNFNSLSEIVDILGGIDIELTSEEIFWLNGYAAETSQVVGKETTHIDENAPGVHHLDGIQAVSFTRIRYTQGDDFKRAQRQRIVLEQILKKIKSSGPWKWMQIVENVLPQISTNMDTATLLKLGAQMFHLKIGEMKGFPFDIATSDSVIGLAGSYAAAIGHADNVKQLHEFFFQEMDYQPSEVVLQVDADVAYLTGIYPENYIQ